MKLNFGLVKMFAREIEKEIQDLACQYPVVTVLGPRQSGKTTLVRHCFEQKPYVNLEYPDIRKFALEDPRSFLEQYPNGAILGEIQRVPILLSYIQPLVDEKDQKGRFILTGSHQLELQEAISQSLAGRTAIVKLLPLNLSEIQKAGFDFSIDQWMLYGGYPRIYKDQLNPTKTYQNYVQTYIERDLRQLIQVKDLLQFERFIQILAGRTAQILNLEQIGNEVGLSSHTVKHWISILEASFIVFRLPAYFENFSKRVIKSPKIYFTDTGLATYLLGIENEVQLSRDPLRGHLFENAIVLDLMKSFLNTGKIPSFYYYRDIAQNEIDLIYKKGHRLIPIEIKSSKTFHPNFLQSIELFQKIAAKHTDLGFVIYAGDLEQKIRKTQVVNYKKAFQALSQS